MIDPAAITHEVRLGDSRDLLRELPDACVDALVTDPPAGIGFMGKDWDDYRRSHNEADVGRDSVFGRTSRVAPEVGRAREGFRVAMRPIFSECLRVLKPGAHGVVWALPRTSHWTATALEDAGFEIRDVIVHLFGTGFPKSLDVRKATGAARWQGYGTALKPAAEHWILVRKPLAGTVAENVLAHGTGGLNIDGCRIPGKWTTWQAQRGDPLPANGPPVSSVGWGNGFVSQEHPAGRWPGNVTLDEEAAAMLDAQSGERGAFAQASGPTRTGPHQSVSMSIKPGTDSAAPFYGDAGGASRFFYVAKPDRAERDEGITSAAKSGGEATDRVDGSDGLKSPRAGAGRNGGARNHHPTVKAVSLMRWLVRLVTPPGGLVLDPFAGSGSTGIAAFQEDKRFLGFEREPEYHRLAVERIAKAREQMRLPWAEGT